MYSNLKAEMARKGISQKEIAMFLHIHENSMSSKINGYSPISIEEAFKIRNKYFPNFDLQYLFSKESA